MATGDWLRRFERALESIGAWRLCACGPDCACAVQPPEKPKPAAQRFSHVPAPELLPGPDQIEQPGMVRFRCECGKTLKVKWEYAGKTGRCPTCHKLIHIPEA
jgi:hypothetical protein